MQLEFFVPGKPVPKARARTVRVKGRTMSYTPEATANYELYVRWSAAAEMAGREPAVGPLAMNMIVCMPVPASWSAKRRDQAIAGELLPIVKPDLSNIVKAVEDALNGIVYVDDSQIVSSTTRKVYSATPGVRVKITPALPASH